MRDLTRRFHSAIPPVLPPSGPVPAEKRLDWAKQCFARAEHHYAAGQHVEGNTVAAYGRHQVALVEGRVR